MTRTECAIILDERIKNFTLAPVIYDSILIELENMHLIKFENEREATIKEAESYLKSGIGYRLDEVGKYHSLIKRLLALVK
jgi:hypothetical protein